MRLLTHSRVCADFILGRTRQADLLSTDPDRRLHHRAGGTSQIERVRVALYRKSSRGTR